MTIAIYSRKSKFICKGDSIATKNVALAQQIGYNKCEVVTLYGT
jgi:hypothetical protein